MKQLLNHPLTRLAVAAAALLAATSANAQFITGSNSTFTGSTTGAYNASSAPTVPGTNWEVSNTTATRDYLVGGTGDGLNYTPDASTGTSGDKYLALAGGHSAALQLQPNSFTGIGGASAFTYSLSFITQGFTSNSNNEGNQNGFSFAAVAYSWTVGRATSLANALAGTWSSTLGSGSGTTNNTSSWETVNGNFTTPAGGPYTNVYFRLTATNNPNISNEFVGIDNVTAVPEPETFAMLLAGLGAIGFMSRRRMNRGA